MNDLLRDTLPEIAVADGELGVEIVLLDSAAEGAAEDDNAPVAAQGWDVLPALRRS